MHVGLADFAEPTLLILGDATSLNWLADYIESRQSLDFAAVAFVKLVNVGLLLDSTAGDGGVNRHEAKFNWKVSLPEAQQFAEQLRALAASEVPAHAYLDSAGNTSGVEIVASKGEYSPDTIFIP